MTRCTACQAEIGAGERFCGECGASAPGVDARPFAPSARENGDVIKPASAGAGPVALAKEDLSPDTPARGFTPPVAFPQPDASPATSAAAPSSPPGPEPKDGYAGRIDGLRLAYGEVVKGVFDLTRVARPLGTLTGQVVVTDARVIYRAEAKTIFSRSMASQEIALADVNGMSVATFRGLSPLGLVGMGFLGLLAIIFFLIGWGFWVIVCVALFVITALVSVSTELVFMINAKQSETSPIAVQSGIRRAASNPIAVAFRAAASPFVRILGLLGVVDAGTAVTTAGFDEVSTMYADIGALVLDLQTRGHLADGVQPGPEHGFPHGGERSGRDAG